MGGERDRAQIEKEIKSDDYRSVSCVKPAPSVLYVAFTDASLSVASEMGVCP